MINGEKDKCCGCMACQAACPIDCISMSVDDEGFSYPTVNEARCIKCGACVRACAFKRDQHLRSVASIEKEDGADSAESIYGRWGAWKTPVSFAAKHQDSEVRLASRSGGVFSALSDAVLERGGVVYGCVLDDDHRAVHIRTTTASGRDRMRGSKYVQSDVSGIPQQVRADLLKGRKVLFSGTSCQVAGLRSFIGDGFEHLICVDVVCMGVPSPRVWSDYLAWCECRSKSRVVDADFRNKRDFGWAASVESIYLENGRRIDAKVFTTLFLDKRILRRSCYACPYKDVVHPGDITLADYWGIKSVVPGFDDDKGVSLVLVNNEKGRQAFEEIRPLLDVVQTRVEDSLQPSLVAPCAVPRRREEFWRDYRRHGFSWIIRRYGAYGLVWKAMRRVGLEIRRLLKS